jgi:hypothetical protein
MLSVFIVLSIEERKLQSANLESEGSKSLF